MPGADCVADVNVVLIWYSKCLRSFLTISILPQTLHLKNSRNAFIQSLNAILELNKILPQSILIHMARNVFEDPVFSFKMKATTLDIAIGDLMHLHVMMLRLLQ